MFEPVHVVLLVAVMCTLLNYKLGAWAAFATSIVLSLTTGRMDWRGGVWLILTAGLLILSSRTKRRDLRCGAGTIFFLVAFSLSDHQLPGFKNLLALDQIRLASDSAPFTLYLNFDKTALGLLLCLLYRPLPNVGFTRGRCVSILKTWAAVVGLLMPLALLVQYVRFDFKTPAFTWIWLLNNFFFVCFAEEALFRGFVQSALRSSPRVPPWLAISAGAFAFGLLHYRGGPIYIGFATVAGLFYGYAFERTQRLGAAMAVHFGLNTVHFFLFSYPSRLI